MTTPAMNVSANLELLHLALNDRELRAVDAWQHKHETEYIRCGCCMEWVKPSLLRKLPGWKLSESMCLPCFHHNHTDLPQDLIDAMVKVYDDQYKK